MPDKDGRYPVPRSPTCLREGPSGQSPRPDRSWNPEYRAAARAQAAADRQRRQAARLDGDLDGVDRDEVELWMWDAEDQLEGWDAERLRAAERVG